MCLLERALGSIARVLLLGEKQLSVARCALQGLSGMTLCIDLALKGDNLLLWRDIGSEELGAQFAGSQFRRGSGVSLSHESRDRVLPGSLSVRAGYTLALGPVCRFFRESFGRDLCE